MILFSILSVLLAVSAMASDSTRISVTVADVSLTTADSMAIVPVYLSNPLDNLAGIELYFKIDENRIISFASDEVDSTGMSGALDTAGTLLSGWEWIGISSLENGLFDLKIAAMADWPNGTFQPPCLPQDGGVLGYLRLRINREQTKLSGGRIAIKIIRNGCGFSDPVGNSIGVTTKMEKQCQEMVGDSCLKWATVRVGFRDPAMIKLRDGSVTIIDPSIEEESNSEEQ